MHEHEIVLKVIHHKINHKALFQAGCLNVFLSQVNLSATPVGHVSIVIKTRGI